MRIPELVRGGTAAALLVGSTAAAVVGHVATVLLEPAGSATPTGVVDEPNVHQFERVAGGMRTVVTYGADDRTVALGIISTAVSDGTAEADDAASEAAALGFGPATPIVFDMESYSSSSTTAVLQFLIGRGWNLYS